MPTIAPDIQKANDIREKIVMDVCKEAVEQISKIPDKELLTMTSNVIRLKIKIV